MNYDDKNKVPLPDRQASPLSTCRLLTRYVLIVTLALLLVITQNAAAAIVLNSRLSVVDPSGFASSDGNGLGYTGGVGTSSTTEDPYAWNLFRDVDSPTGGFHADSLVNHLSSLSYDIDGYLINASGQGLTTTHAVNPTPPPIGESWAKAETYFDIFFTVTDTPSAVLLSGNLSVSGDLGTDAYAEVRLLNSATDEVYNVRLDFPLNSGSIPFSQQLTLAPGDYSLHMRSYSHNPINGESSSAWNASMIVVPEPSTPLLILFGSISLIMKRRRI